MLNSIGVSHTPEVKYTVDSLKDLLLSKGIFDKEIAHGQWFEIVQVLNDNEGTEDELIKALNKTRGIE